MTRPPVDARKATCDDLDDLVLLWARAREELGRGGRLPSVPQDQVRARLAEVLTGGDPVVLIGRSEGTAAGYAVLRPSPMLLADGDTMHLEQLFVVPEARRRGVARALLALATSVAERHGADQLTAAAPPAARDTHRFLARLGFSPLVVRRVVGTAALRRRLSGEGPRRGLEDLLSRRRSLRARSMRAGWGGSRPESSAEGDDDPETALPGPPSPSGHPTPSPGSAGSPGSPGVAEAGAVRRVPKVRTPVTLPDGVPQQIDLSTAGTPVPAVPAPGTAPDDRVRSASSRRPRSSGRTAEGPPA